MTAEHRKVYELNRIDILPFILISMIFVALCLWLLSMNPDKIASLGGRHGNPITHYIMSTAGLLFFGSIAVSATIKLFGRKEGVIVDCEGITDNSSGLAAGFLPWSAVKKTQIRRGFLVVYLNEPGDFLKRTRLLKRLPYRLNLRFYGSPVIISDKVLNGSIRDIREAAEEYRKEFTPASEA